MIQKLLESPGEISSSYHHLNTTLPHDEEITHNGKTYKYIHSGVKEYSFFNRIKRFISAFFKIIITFGKSYSSHKVQKNFKIFWSGKKEKQFYILQQVPFVYHSPTPVNNLPTPLNNSFAPPPSPVVVLDKPTQDFIVPSKPKALKPPSWDCNQLTAECVLFIDEWKKLPDYNKTLCFVNFAQDLFLENHEQKKEKILNDLGGIVNQLILTNGITFDQINEIILGICGLQVAELDESIKEELLDQLKTKSISLNIIYSYRFFLHRPKSLYQENTFKKGTEEAYQALLKQLEKFENFSNKDAENLLKDEEIRKIIDQNELGSIISNMLICTINLDGCNRNKINDLLCKGVQILRIKIANTGKAGDLKYGSTGVCDHVFGRLFSYLGLSRDQSKISYKNQDKLVQAYKPTLHSKDKEHSIPLVLSAYNNGHFTNQILIFQTDMLRNCDNLAAGIEFNEMPTTNHGGGEIVYLPLELAQKIKDDVHLENLCVPKWEANNCYLSAAWLKFAIMVYVYTCAYEAEKNSL